MQIRSYQYSDHLWRFDTASLGRLNLVVGDSASGKTRFLNTIFSLGLSVVRPGDLITGRWDVRLQQGAHSWLWQLEVGQDKQVVRERISRIEDGREVDLVRRTPKSFKFQRRTLPKMSRASSAIHLLGDEEALAPLRTGFRALRRDFAGGAFTNPFLATPLLIGEQELCARGREALYTQELPVHVLALWLRGAAPELFHRLQMAFCSAFPFVRELVLSDLSALQPAWSVLGPTPVLCVREKGIDGLIPCQELSSGMKKVLLLLMDLCTIPDGWTYLIDEYENSLGISAIDAFPAFLTDLDRDLQIILTSHHPYIINQIPVEHWLVFSRRGGQVSIRGGEENLKRYGRSRQQRFAQLINDPFYRGEEE